jgi:hypothetical protein
VIHLKAHRTAASLVKKGCYPPHRTHQRRAECQTARGLRRSRQTIDISNYRGQRVSDYRSAATVLPTLPGAETLIADKGVAARLA